MTELGFVFDPILYPQAHHNIEDLPVFVATVDSNELHSFHRFLGSFRLYFRQKKLVVYDLGLTAEELRLVRNRDVALQSDLFTSFVYLMWFYGHWAIRYNRKNTAD